MTTISSRGCFESASLMKVGCMITAFRASCAIKSYIQNIVTQPGETEMYSAADHVEALAQHCGGILFSNVLLNNGRPSPEILKKYGAEHAGLVEIDRDRLHALGLNLE